MTRIAFVLFLSSFWFLNQLSAQEKDSIQKAKIDFSVLEPKIRFCSRNELGGLIGIGHVQDMGQNPEWALELTSINGIRYKPLFVGIGVGIRSWRGVGFGFPVYGHVALDLWKTGLFLHTDLGYQIAARENYIGNRETGGFYAAYGLGYNFAIKKQALYVKASICHQKAKTEDYGGLGPSTYQTYSGLNYLFCRISLGLTFTK